MTGRFNNRHQQVGLDRRIRLEWLQQTVELVLAGNDKDEIKVILQEHLQGQLPAQRKSVRGSQSKTITILMKIWVGVPSELAAFRDAGLALLQTVSCDHRIAIHWGMIMAIYPFWGAVAANVGRLLRLQDTIVASQVQRRVREIYGERETVSRRVRYVLRTFIDWGVLFDTDSRGIYRQGPSLSINDDRLIAWLIEATLHSRSNTSFLIKELLEGTRLFPFKLEKISAEKIVTYSKALDLVQSGLGEEIVILKNVGK